MSVRRRLSEKPAVSPRTDVASSGRAGRSRSKYEHYLFVVSALVMTVSVLALLNAYFHFYNASSYSASQVGVSSPYLLAAYLGIFLTIVFSPVPDYLLLPVYGFLSSVGLLNPVVTFLVCLAGAVVPIEYVCGRFAARPLLLKGLSYFRITEQDIKVADDWLVEHGKFSIFISTFIPFFYSVASLAAGTLRMGAAAFLLDSAVGFGVRYAALEYLGYYGIYVFTSSFDYSQRALFSALLILSFVYAAIYLVGTFRPPSRAVSAS